MLQALLKLCLVGTHFFYFQVSGKNQTCGSFSTLYTRGKEKKIYDRCHHTGKQLCKWYRMGLAGTDSSWFCRCIDDLPHQILSVKSFWPLGKKYDRSHLRRQACHTAHRRPFHFPVPVSLYRACRNRRYR